MFFKINRGKFFVYSFCIYPFMIYLYIDMKYKDFFSHLLSESTTLYVSGANYDSQDLENMKVYIT